MPDPDDPPCRPVDTLTVTAVCCGSCALVVVTGDLTRASLPLLQQELADVVGRGSRDVTLDASDLRLGDAAALGVVLAGAAHLRERGGDLVVLAPPVALLALLDVLGIRDGVTVRPQHVDVVDGERTDHPDGGRGR